MKLFIVIPVHNRAALTLRCFASLKAQSHSSFTVVLVDDGSTDGTRERVLQEFGAAMDIQILNGTGSLFWGGAVELGMRRALDLGKDDDLVMTLNDDVELDPSFLGTVVRVKERYPGALVGAVSCEQGVEDRVAVTGWRILCWPLAWTQRVWWPLTIAELRRQPEDVTPVDFLPGTATAVELGVVRRFGPVNGKWLSHYHADSEFSYRMKRHGVPVLVARDLVLKHNLQSTGLGGSEFHRVSLWEFARSFFTVRSGYSLRQRWRFARACCPVWAIPAYLASDTVKALVRGGATCLLGGQAASALKRMVNRA